MSDVLERRDFLKGAAALALPAPALYDGEISDTHLHLWDLKALRLPWVQAATGRAKDVLAHDHGLADFAEASRGLGVKRAVYMEVDVAEPDEVKEAEYASRLCAEGRLAGAVISGRPGSDGFGAYLDRVATKHVKGLRQLLQAQPKGYGLAPAFVNGVRTLGDRGLSFDLCVRNDQLDDGFQLIQRCPGTRFVLDHCGNPHSGPASLEEWRRGITKIAGLKNVVCKISGLYANVQASEWPAERLAPVVRSVIDAFGWDRVMFAGDWPVVNLGGSYQLWVAALKAIVRDDGPEKQSKLFRDNAVKVYRLV